MQRRLLNKFINSLKNLDFKYIEEKILNNPDEINAKNLHISYENQHPIFEITKTVFETIQKNPKNKTQILDIFSDYIKKSEFTLNIPYFHNRNIAYSSDLFTFVNYHLIDKIEKQNIDIINDINLSIIKSGLNKNITCTYPSGFILSIIEKHRRNDDKQLIIHSEYLKNFFFNNFDFTDIKNNSLVIGNIIKNFISSYSDRNEFSYSILENFLNNKEIKYDINIIRKELQDYFIDDSYVTSIHKKTTNLLIKYNLDYIFHENEKKYLYPYFMNDEKADREIYKKYLDKQGILYLRKGSITFDNVSSYLKKSLNYNFSVELDFFKNNDIEINKYDDFYDFVYNNVINKEHLLDIKPSVLQNKFNFIQKYNLKINHHKLIESLNDKIRYIKTLNTLYTEDTIHKNIMAFIDHHIQDINYNEKEQPLIETIHIINSLHKHKMLKDFILEKIKFLKFNDEHFYNNISFKELKTSLNIETKEYIPHVNAEKLLSVNLRKNIKKINSDFVYNNNSIFSSLFSEEGKYTWGMNKKRREIADFLDSQNKMDSIYCISNGNKILRSEHLAKIMIEKTLFDMPNIDYLMKQIKNETNFKSDKLSRTKKDLLAFLCFQRTCSFYTDNEYFSKLAEDLYPDEDTYLYEFIHSFSLKKEDYNTVSVDKYKIDDNDKFYIDLINKIKNVKDNSFLDKIQETVINKFYGKEKNLLKFKNIISSIKEKNDLNVLIDNPILKNENNSIHKRRI